MNTSTSTLMKKSILKPSGEINKDKINLVAGAVTQPFAEMVWVTTGGDMDTINRLTDILVTMNTPADRASCSSSFKCSTGLWACSSPMKPRRWAHTRRRWTTFCSLSRQISGSASRTISRTALEPFHRARRRSENGRRFFCAQIHERS